MLCRSSSKCSAARDEILAAATGSSASADDADLVVGPDTDLGSLASTRAAVEWVKKSVPALHILVANAGGMLPHGLTRDGIERTFQINHLGVCA